MGLFSGDPKQDIFFSPILMESQSERKGDGGRDIDIINEGTISRMKIGDGAAGDLGEECKYGMLLRDAGVPNSEGVSLHDAAKASEGSRFALQRFTLLRDLLDDQLQHGIHGEEALALTLDRERRGWEGKRRKRQGSRGGSDRRSAVH